MKNDIITIGARHCALITRPKSRKKYFENIVILRIIFILLLVWTHAFAPWHGSWKIIDSQVLAPDYFEWAGMIAYYIFMPGFLFISGYLWRYSYVKSKQTLSISNYLYKKFKRLIIPCIILGAVYYCLFNDVSAPFITIVYSIVSGCGHLWFLPMLFWCFVFCCAIINYPPPPEQYKLLLQYLR